MRLKTLEIKGFKSFAHETVLNFNESITGVVGPNGSGKSNIVDAIRWVLGEQSSRELRLDKMSSVIFNGTKTRKPGQFAQVTLTFENTKNLLPTEFHHVAIARILYASGESEYRLNGVTCRLKDITNLFLDTGVGSNSYAIISLGMVDDLLADKENARIRMFEQAAGVSKYKTRKNETLNKLNSTTADLDRVEDLLHEIEGNLTALEKQAKRTQKYFDMKAEYKTGSLSLAVLKLRRAEEKIRQLNAQLEKSEDLLRTAEIEYRNIEASIESDKKQYLDLEVELSTRQREVNQLTAIIHQLENEKKMAAQRRDFVRENKVKLEKQVRQDADRTHQIREDIEYYRTETSAEKRVEARMELELVSLEEKLVAIRANYSTIKSDLDGTVKAQQQIEQAIFEWEKKKAIAQNQIENLQADIRRNESEVIQRTTDAEQMNAALFALQTKEQAAETSLKTLENEEATRLKNIQTTENELDTHQKNLAEIHRKLDAKRNEYKLTKSLVENFEGYPDSIQFLSNAKNGWKASAPLVSDLIYCQEKYRVAIENFLEPYLNYYVTETLAQAHDAIKLLNNAQKGKANFFVMEAFQETKTDNISPSAEAVRALDGVEFEPKHAALWSYLLDNVWIINDDVVDLLDKKSLAQQTILAKSGSIVHRAKSVYGGSVGLFEGKKIGRRKNMEILEISIKDMETKRVALASEADTLKNQLQSLKSQALQPKIQEARNAQNRIAQERVALQTKLETLDIFLKETGAKNADANEKINTFYESIENIDIQLLDYQDKIYNLKNNASSKDDSFRNLSDEVTKASTKFNEKNIEFIRQQNKVTALQRELSFREKQIKETETFLQSNQQTLNQSDDEIHDISETIRLVDTNLAYHYGERKEKQQYLSQAEQVYATIRNGVRDFEDRLRALLKQQTEHQIGIAKVRDQINALQSERTSVTDRMSIEFGVEIDELTAMQPNSDIKESELQPIMDKLKRSLDNYGEINPLAVEAYKEIKERYDTIVVQRDDILAAKNSLLLTIKEIEDTATTQFMVAFEQVRANFIEVFRSLFTEDDSCDLVLVNPENPLDSGINILAKPKGKRPQTIAQLSGGEKTLTATALLFALYLLKPAPFCIFDEVDAPLDDANIEKFNRIIEKFSKDSQFIIVTHNKATMAAVDVIYGVYMPEQGVSAVAPVDFRTFKDVKGMQALSKN
jgi:chromosome segregation protein